MFERSKAPELARASRTANLRRVHTLVRRQRRLSVVVTTYMATVGPSCRLRLRARVIVGSGRRRVTPGPSTSTWPRSRSRRLCFCWAGLSALSRFPRSSSPLRRMRNSPIACYRFTGRQRIDSQVGSAERSNNPSRAAPRIASAHRARAPARWCAVLEVAGRSHCPAPPLINSTAPDRFLLLVQLRLGQLPCYTVILILLSLAVGRDWSRKSLWAMCWSSTARAAGASTTTTTRIARTTAATSPKGAQLLHGRSLVRVATSTPSPPIASGGTTSWNPDHLGHAHCSHASHHDSRPRQEDHHRYDHRLS